MSTCTEHRMLNMLHHSSIFYQLAQARPHNVLHFLVALLCTLSLNVRMYYETDATKRLIQLSFVPSNLKHG